MAAETLEDHKPQPPNGDAAPKAEADKHENQAAKPKAEDEQQHDTGVSDEVASAGVDNSEDVNANDEGQEEEEKNQEDADHEEEEEEEGEKGKSQKEKKKKKKESDPATPATASESRPTRERKSVERYTVSSPHKFPRSSATKTFSIDKVFREFPTFFLRIG